MCIRDRLQPFVALVELGLAAQVGAGAHHAHVALQHIQELGHLIQARLAHEGAHAGHAGVVGAVVGGAVLHDQVGGVHAHGAQLVHLEVAAAKPHAWGVVEDRALVLEDVYKRQVFKSYQKAYGLIRDR